MSAKLSAGGSLALIALCIFGAASSFAEVAEIKIARQFGISFLPLHVMQDKKLFEKHAKAAGLDTQATYLQIAGGASQKEFGKGNEFKFDNLSVSMATPDATAALLSGGGEIHNLPGS